MTLKRKIELNQLVDEASRESFPASDPPVWCTGLEGREPDQEKE